MLLQLQLLLILLIVLVLLLQIMLLMLLLQLPLLVILLELLQSLLLPPADDIANTTDPTASRANATCSAAQRLPSLSVMWRFPDRGKPRVGKVNPLNIHEPPLLSRVARPFRHPTAAAPAPISPHSLARSLAINLAHASRPAVPFTLIK